MLCPYAVFTKWQFYTTLKKKLSLLLREFTHMRIIQQSSRFPNIRSTKEWGVYWTAKYQGMETALIHLGSLHEQETDHKMHWIWFITANSFESIHILKKNRQNILHQMDLRYPDAFCNGIQLFHEYGSWTRGLGTCCKMTLLQAEFYHA